MNISLKIEGGVIQWQNAPEGFNDGEYIVDIRNPNTYTRQQQKALYLYMQMIANSLNKENITTNQILKADINWTMEKVKVMIMRPLIEALFGTTTTTKLKKDDFDLLIDTLTKMLGMKGISIPEFPSIENKGK